MTWTWPIGVFHPPWPPWLALTNRDPGPGLMLESREEELGFCRKGWGRVRSGYSSGRGVRSACGSWWHSHTRQGRAACLRRRALLSPGVESDSSCRGPGAPPETGGKPSACESSPACLSAGLNHTGFSVLQLGPLGTSGGPSSRCRWAALSRGMSCFFAFCCDGAPQLSRGDWEVCWCYMLPPSMGKHYCCIDAAH